MSGWTKWLAEHGTFIADDDLAVIPLKTAPPAPGQPMNTLTRLLLASAAALASLAHAAAPTDAPSGTTGICRDGTYSDSAEKKGACRGHKGVKEWYSEASTAPAAPAASARAPAPAPSTPTTPPPGKATSPAVAGRTSGTPAQQAAPGGGPGQVWANTSTKVYHCSGDKYYGTTKHGEYMTEADAKAKGYHADHGKACA